MIILTSNLGSDILASQPEGEDSDAVRAQVMEVVRRAFRPEFLNRLDEVLLFHRLTRPQMTGIVDIQLRSEEHTSELQSLMRNSYAVFRLNNKTQIIRYTAST